MPDRGDLTLVPRPRAWPPATARAPVLTDVSFALHAGERMGVLGPNGGGKTTLFRVAARRAARRWPGRCGAARASRVVPQTERSRLDFPVSALDVALMGAISTPALVAAPGPRASARAARGGARPRSGWPSRPTRPSATSRAASASACWSRARSCRTRGCSCSTSPSPGSTRRAPSASRRCSATLAGEGRGVLIATHDVEQARGWDTRAVPQRPPGRLRAARRDAAPRRARGDLRRRDRRAARAASCARVLPPHHHH